MSQVKTVVLEVRLGVFYSARVNKLAKRPGFAIVADRGDTHYPIVDGWQVLTLWSGRYGDPPILIARTKVKAAKVRRFFISLTLPRELIEPNYSELFKAFGVEGQDVADPQPPGLVIALLQNILETLIRAETEEHPDETLSQS